MPVLKVTITARSPLVFSERRPGGQFRPSTLYIPGAVIRGALAQQFLDLGQEGGEDFRSLFTDDAPVFRNAYPAIFHAASDDFMPSMPVPATAYTCKIDGGFVSRRRDSGEPKGHGVFDGLIDRLCCESLKVAAPYVASCNHPEHEGRGERVKTQEGFYAVTPDGPQGAKIGLRLTTRVAINRRRRVAEGRMLYSPLVISETTTIEAEGVETEHATTFQGSVLVGEASRPVVERCLPQLTHVGSGVARGFGRVEVNIGEPEPDDLGRRVEEFRKAVARRWALWEQHRKMGEAAPEYGPGGGVFFSVTLLSDAILRDDGWSPTVRLSPEMLGKAGRNATLVRTYATADYRGGWNTAWRLPKDTELVARMGSVYVYHTKDSVSDADGLTALKELEERGVGERRREGFGQVRVCDEFHGMIWEG